MLWQRIQQRVRLHIGVGHCTRAIARFSLLLQSTSCLKCLKKEHVIISSSRGLHSHPHAWSAHLVGETEFLSDFPAASRQPNSRSDPELSRSLLSSGQCLLHMYCFSVPRALAKCTTHVCVWLSSFLAKILHSRQELLASDRTVTKSASALHSLRVLDLEQISEEF